MCLKRSTWRRIHGWTLVVLFSTLIVAWGQLLLAMQPSQDAVNATLTEQMRENRERIAWLEGWRDRTDERLNKLSWISAIASGPLFIEVVKYLLAKKRQADEPPPRILDRRRRTEDEDLND